MRYLNQKDLHNFLRRAACLVLALALMLGLPVCPDAGAASDGMIRVKLTRLGTQSSIRFTTSCGYVLRGDVPMNIPSGASVTVTAEGNEMWVSCGGVNVNAGGTARLLRTSGGNCGVKFNSPALSNVFCGDMYFTASGGTITPILHIYIEDYLYGVVAYEMSNSFPLEALKAQAVAARNYALRKKASGSSKAYDVTDTTSDQVFRGYNASYARVIQAVNETAGQTLYSGGSMINCYYTASNGGQTESTANIWGGKLAYSVVKDDPYDLENASSRKKTAVISKNASGLKEELEAALLSGISGQLTEMNFSANAEDVSIVAISEIVPSNPKYDAPSRLYQTLSFTMRVSSISNETGKRSYAVVTADVDSYGALETWYALSINSGGNETVEVVENEDTFEIIFRRYGHGVGMSQRGAQTMADVHGMGFDEILAFYYPGTELRTLSLSDSGGSGSAGVEDEAIATAKLASACELLEAAEPDADVLAGLASGASAEVYAVNGRWARIGVRGLAGYVRTDVLENLVLSNDPLDEIEEEAMQLAQAAGLMELPWDTAYRQTVLFSGEQVTVLAKSRAWAQVRTAAGQAGYVPLDALMEVQPTEEPTEVPTEEPTEEPTAEPTAAPTDEPSAAPTEGPSPTVRPTLILPELTEAPTSTPVPTFAPWPTQEAVKDYGSMDIPSSATYAYVDITGGTLIMRKRAATASIQVGSLSRNACVQVLAYDTDWSYIMTGSGLTGFVSTRYLRFDAGDEIAQPTASPTLAPTPTPAPTFAPLPTQEAPDDGFQAISGTKYGYVSVERARLYRDCTENSSVLDTLSYSESMRITAYSGGWYRVICDGQAGYMRRCDVSQTRPPRIVETDVVFCSITAKTRYSARMYKKNSTSSAVLGSLPAGVTLSVSAYNDNWAYVRYGGKTGFVQIKYLKAIG